MAEPTIHSHLEDCLEEDDPLAYECVYCKLCEVMVHAANNECMQSWVRYEDKAVCLICFSRWCLEKNKPPLDSLKGQVLGADMILLFID